MIDFPIVTIKAVIYVYKETEISQTSSNDKGAILLLKHLKIDFIGNIVGLPGK